MSTNFDKLTLADVRAANTKGKFRLAPPGKYTVRVIGAKKGVNKDNNTTWNFDFRLVTPVDDLDLDGIDLSTQRLGGRLTVKENTLWLIDMFVTAFAPDVDSLGDITMDEFFTDTVPHGLIGVEADVDVVHEPDQKGNPWLRIKLGTMKSGKDIVLS